MSVGLWATSTYLFIILFSVVDILIRKTLFIFSFYTFNAFSDNKGNLYLLLEFQVIQKYIHFVKNKNHLNFN